MSVQLEQWSFIDSSRIKTYDRNKVQSCFCLFQSLLTGVLRDVLSFSYKQHDNITIILLVKLPYFFFYPSELMLFIFNIL